MDAQPGPEGVAQRAKGRRGRAGGGMASRATLRYTLVHEQKTTVGTQGHPRDGARRPRPVQGPLPDGGAARAFPQRHVQALHGSAHATVRPAQKGAEARTAERCHAPRAIAGSSARPAAAATAAGLFTGTVAHKDTRRLAYSKETRAAVPSNGRARSPNALRMAQRAVPIRRPQQGCGQNGGQDNGNCYGSQTGCQRSIKTRRAGWLDVFPALPARAVSG